MTKPINRVDRSEVEHFKASASWDGQTLNQYQELATRSAIYPGQGTPFGLMYAALGLAEAGEFQNKVKKLFRDDGVITLEPGYEGGFECYFSAISPERKAQLIKELGGLLWYAAACCNEIGTTMAEVAVANLLELASRSERGTLSGSGDER